VNARGFALMLVFAVAVSIVLGLVVERFTAPGWERTFWFGVGLAAILFPAGRFAERRGWIHGFWHAGPAARANASPPAAEQASPTAPAAAPTNSPNDATASSVTRASSGESR
jgi:hypothetical protein